MACHRRLEAVDASSMAPRLALPEPDDVGGRCVEPITPGIVLVQQRGEVGVRLLDSAIFCRHRPLFRSPSRASVGPVLRLELEADGRSFATRCICSAETKLDQRPPSERPTSAT